AGRRGRAREGALRQGLPVRREARSPGRGGEPSTAGTGTHSTREGSTEPGAPGGGQGEAVGRHGGQPQHSARGTPERVSTCRDGADRGLSCRSGHMSTSWTVLRRFARPGAKVLAMFTDRHLPAALM